MKLDQNICSNNSSAESKKWFLFVEKHGRRGGGGQLSVYGYSENLLTLY